MLQYYYNSYLATKLEEVKETHFMDAMEDE